jgi:hypothetical protein
MITETLEGGVAAAAAFNCLMSMWFGWLMQASSALHGARVEYITVPIFARVIVFVLAAVALVASALGVTGALRRTRGLVFAYGIAAALEALAMAGVAVAVALDRFIDFDVFCGSQGLVGGACADTLRAFSAGSASIFALAAAVVAVLSLITVRSQSEEECYAVLR